MPEEYSLDDLVRLSGLPLRTIRFYMQEGLLKGPDSRGKFAHYSQPHLDQLELISRLKKLHIPLQQIRQLINNMTPDEVQQLCQYQNILSPNIWNTENQKISHPYNEATGSSALEYIKGIEQTVGRIHGRSAYTSSQHQKSKDSPKSSLFEKPHPNVHSHEVWQRIVLADGIEVQIRGDKVIDENMITTIISLLQKK